MIRAVMAKFQFECLAAEGQAAELVAEANAKDWDAPQQLTNVCDGVAYGLGIARAVREEDAMRFDREDVFGGSLRGDNGDITVVVNKEAQDILLDAEVVRDDTIALSRFRG